MLYPRLGRGRRLFWRDLHAVTGLWVSVLALFLIPSGLPWAKSWGGYLKEVRHLAGAATVRQDWTTGRSDELAQRAALSSGSLAGQEVARQDAMADMPGMRQPTSRLPAGAYAAIDRVAPTVARLHLADPVLVSPPLAAGAAWSGRSDAQDRPKRVTLRLDGASGRLLKREDFSQGNWVDQAIGVGVAAHEGQLFGWPNQLLGLVTASGLAAVSVSAVVLWWRRRSGGVLGAPLPAAEPHLAVGLMAIIAVGAVLLPLFGLSLLAVLLAERLALRHFRAIREWIGLRPAFFADQST